MNNVESKWMQMLDEFAPQITELPDWAEQILLEDLSTVVQRRIEVMQKASKTTTKGGIQ